MYVSLGIPDHFWVKFRTSRLLEALRVTKAEVQYENYAYTPYGDTQARGA